MSTLLDDVGYVALHYHWGHDELMSLPVSRRKEFCKRINDHNEELNKQARSGR